MLSGQIGRYRYYELEDIHQSRGCRLCRVDIFSKPRLVDGRTPEEVLHERCIRCPLFFATKLTKLYAQQLAEIDERYEDDGK